MSKTRIPIDADGDVLVILPVNNSTGVSESPESPIEKHFVCSKKHLTLASPRAAKVFSSGFKEASKEDDGLYHWKFDETFDDRAFDLVLKVIHGKTRDVPQFVDLSFLAAIAMIVDDLQCHDAFHFYGRGWISSFYGLFKPNLRKEMSETLVQYIFVSSIFEHEPLFEHSTKTAIENNNGEVPTFGLPIRTDVSGEIEKRRLVSLKNLASGLDDLQDRLSGEHSGCSQGCSSMLLGALMKGRKVAGLHAPLSSTPFLSLTLDNVINSLRDIQSPTYFGSEKDGVVGKYSGKWTLSVHSIAPPPKPSSNAPAAGGLFGTSIVTPIATTPDLNREHDPISLVRHNCSLKDLVDPLLDEAVAEIKGLKLADYSRN